MTSTAVSAPGKVLLAGGYLVVDRAYTGLVFGLSARIHVHVQHLPTRHGVSPSEILVRSPQFRGAVWSYGYRVAEQGAGVEVVQLKGRSTWQQSRNKFVETALVYALSYVSTHGASRIGPATITILADADYYSQTEAGAGVAGFVDFGVALSEAHKTGLGSSAALVTAFTAAVLIHYLGADSVALDTEVGRARVHNLAQAAHCTAQGKIGSGFDVAAAVYGSCVYRRFSPSILERVAEAGGKGFSGRLRHVVDDEGAERLWDTVVDLTAVDMPKGLRLVMCDVDCGSATPAMVRKVLSWREDDPEEAALLWETLQRGNEDLASELRRLAKEPGSSLEGLQTMILTVRSLIREMSSKAGVPIEPKVQTDLLDACSGIQGVVGGVVPGAGGYDALALLVEDSESTIANLSHFLESYRAGVGDEGARVGKVRLLGVKQEREGIRSEAVDLYSPWLRRSEQEMNDMKCT